MGITHPMFLSKFLFAFPYGKSKGGGCPLPPAPAQNLLKKSSKLAIPAEPSKNTFWDGFGLPLGSLGGSISLICCAAFFGFVSASRQNSIWTVLEPFLTQIRNFFRTL